MGDIVSPEKRSEMMSGIRSKDTKPEIMIRTGLHNLGFRYKLHDRTLPGKPDLKLTKYNAVVFVHGCFWHKHDCHLFKMPSTRRDFWEKKFEANISNDSKNMALLVDMGWRIAIIWECALKGKRSIELLDILKTCDNWLKSKNRFLEIAGK